jgi:hypothetical protein
MCLFRRVVPTVAALALLAACSGRGSGPVTPSVPAPSVAPTVGVEGGTVSAATARLVVPANALSAPVAVSIRGTTTVPLDPYAALGTAVEVGPAGTAFATPATLVLRYDSGRPPWGVDEAELRLHVLQGGTWHEVPGGGVNPSAREVAAPIASAGVFGVRWIGPSADCRSAEDRQFDFWLGSWDLTVPGGNAGTNDITRHGCVIEEEFHAAAGSIGRSVSFWSARDRQWYQTYIDSMGNRLPLRGVLEAGGMVLYQGTGGGRSTWSPQGPDRVRFVQEAPQGSGWRITFDSTYVKR